MGDSSHPKTNIYDTGGKSLPTNTALLLFPSIRAAQVADLGLESCWTSAVPQLNTAPLNAPVPFSPAAFKMEQAVYMPTLT